MTGSPLGRRVSPGHPYGHRGRGQVNHVRFPSQESNASGGWVKADGREHGATFERLVGTFYVQGGATQQRDSIGRCYLGWGPK